MLRDYYIFVKTLTRHRIYVMIECWKKGLIWTGLIHDYSKYLPMELFPYARYSKGDWNKLRDKSGYYKPQTEDEGFNRALHHHVTNNKHHWQYWVMNVEAGEVTPLRIPKKYLKEMMCDWIGANKVRNIENPIEAARTWYRANRNKILLHEEARSWIMEFLGLEEEEKL